ncbi:D-hexose-6-phosphate mutarotase [Aestuariibacter sp. AA17]|uniref:Putative glucose-6-phosphate 1-epimerase n=1 Tax=Fluctibacter corallii TaxID=2984329 RepID=A0ABT3A6E2_9ALTE|nr:D-hexose-6-phosphate mutarotase [Aestuariibacter sp. AA17]MCV2884249.1 D-hexose-6-phosphate mutarotase [Aestuariibacter sp. AA17]
MEQLSESARLVHRNNIDLIEIDNRWSTATISLFGGHILSYVPKSDGRDRLWVSDAAIMDGSKAIRGGIPICWPWFGDLHGQADTSLPSHGYVRNQTWRIIHIQESDTGTQLQLAPSCVQGKGFLGEASLLLDVHVGDELCISLITKNLGDASLSYTAALHTYFAVDDIKHTELTGLSGEYKDKTQQFAIFQTPEPYRFSAETDRVHLCQPSSLSINNNDKHTLVHSEGHDSIVVWNPWADKSTSMADMTNEGFRNMLCVETAVTTTKVVAPNEKHVIVQRIR